MTEEILKLVITRFCGLENSVSAALSYETKYFKAEGTRSAKGVLSDYIDSLQAVVYTGWDDEFYPQFKIERVTFNK